MEELQTLKKAYELSVEKKTSERNASIAYSQNNSYLSGSVGSDTNSLNISSEQAVLVMSVLNKDYDVHKIVTLIDSDTINISPTIAKFLVDHSIRTNIPIAHTVINMSGKILFETDDVSELIPFYAPKKIILEKVKNAVVERNTDNLVMKNPLDLRIFAIKGIDRNFPLYDKASGYGTALLTKSGKIYFGGQYSGPDKSPSMHSELNTIISAIMHGDRDITHIGLVSSKYPDSPCDMCGICRQFISEMSAKLGISPVLYCFSKDTPEYKEYVLDTYLPSAWTSKKW